MAVDNFANKLQLIQIMKSLSYTVQACSGLTEEQRLVIENLFSDLDIFNLVIAEDVKTLIGPVIAENNRWLRFDPNNKRGLILKGGTFIRLHNGNYCYFENDTYLDFSAYNLNAGTDYFVYLDDLKSISISADSTITDKIKIGRFHTLCVSAGTSLTMQIGTGISSGITTSDKILVKSYQQERDPDFYSFYNCQVTAKTTETYYDLITCTHPLQGFIAGDILPESVFCMTFKPDTLFEDAMVYDKNTNLFVDVYLQSGTGLLTRSKYNATHTVNRQASNFENDLLLVGKDLLLVHEFESAAIGSNTLTNIYGSADQTYVGGHSDTASRRMISAIGCEECCGYLNQCLREFNDTDQDSTWASTDGQDKFGLEYAKVYQGCAGGSWSDTSQGPRTILWNAYQSGTYTSTGSRGCKSNN